jgi:hypothetical protein
LQPGKDVVWTLCGSFQISDLSGSVMFLTAYGAKRNVFGWYATTTKVD